MVEQRMKAREKTVQKMTKDGLVEENLADKSTVRVSSRTRDVQMSKKDTGKGMDLSNRRGTRVDSTDPVRHSVQNSRDAPAKAQTVDKAKSRKMIREQAGAAPVPNGHWKRRKTAVGNFRRSIQTLPSQGEMQERNRPEEVKSRGRSRD